MELRCGVRDSEIQDNLLRDTEYELYYDPF